MIFLKALLLVCATLHAQESIDLPRNEEVESISDATVFEVGEISCAPVEDTLHQHRLCLECLLLKTRCSNSCLTTSGALPYGAFEALKYSTIDKSPDYFDRNSLYVGDDRNAQYIFGDSCVESRFKTLPANHNESSIFYDNSTWEYPRAQERGCPGLTANTASYPRPIFSGCGNAIDDFPAGNDMFYNANPGGSPNYQPTINYAAFVAECALKANNRVKCAKYSAKSWADLISPSNRSHAAIGDCSINDCNTRLNIWERPNKTVDYGSGPKECNQLSSANCLALIKIARNCLNGVDPRCSECFKKIYATDSFKYRFVSKSNEHVVLVWKLYAESSGATSDSAYFYSKIQVEDHNGNAVYSSPVHQKSFTGSFSIFSAITAPASSMKTGEEYFARLYYFIQTDPSLVLKMKITGAEITAVKVRE